MSTREHLQIRIDPGVLLVRDPRVDALKTARLSVEAFALLAKPGDPFLLIGDTVYALTEQEFYALHAVLPGVGLAGAVLDKVLGLDDLSFMSRADADFVEKAREDLPGCPACRRRKYRDAMVQLVKKYGIQTPAPLPVQAPPEYPEVDGELAPLASSLLAHMFSVPAAVRRPCMDCVEKHVSQAWVLGNEALQGYPEHMAFAVGHLGEAIDELPRQLVELERTLVFCLARTNFFRRVFAPLGLIIPLLQAGRRELALDAEEPEDDRMPVDDTLMELDFGPSAGELAALPADLAAEISSRCAEIDKIIPRVENSWCQAALEWEGMMGVLADRLAPVAPAAANVVRNRRLMFRSDPRLMPRAGMPMSDLASKLPELGDGDHSGVAVGDVELV